MAVGILDPAGSTRSERQRFPKRPLKFLNVFLSQSVPKCALL
jgi:hypothetical protein